MWKPASGLAMTGRPSRHVIFPPANTRNSTRCPTRRRAAFLNGWARKEAYLKATGLGIADGLQKIEVTLGPDEPAAFLSPEIAARWTFCDPTASPGRHCSTSPPRLGRGARSARTEPRARAVRATSQWCPCAAFSLIRTGEAGRRSKILALRGHWSRSARSSRHPWGSSARRPSSARTPGPPSAALCSQSSSRRCPGGTRWCRRCTRCTSSFPAKMRNRLKRA